MRSSFVGISLVFCGLLAGACGTSSGATGTTTIDDAAADTQADVALDDAAPDVAGTDATAADATAADASVDAGPMVEKSTKSGKYTLDMVGPTSLKSGEKGAYTLTVIDDQGNAVSGLTVKIAFIHSQMGHGGSGVPKAVDNGDGTYSITGTVPTMGGLWWLEVTIGGEMVKFDVTVG
jgi:hypothetical protein